jgi:phosphoadenosine phosphosulfate reductase
MPIHEDKANQYLKQISAKQRLEWAIDHLPGNIVMSSGFGARSAVMLHLATTVQPNIPVILVDTGYLFPETYHFIDKLVDKFNLNLKIYRNTISPAWLEARYGKLWEQGIEGIHRYNELNKIRPMRDALNELRAGVWVVGLRWSQSDERRQMNFLNQQEGRYKLLPILDWRDKDVHDYLVKHQLPYHPLWHQGYMSIGDVHTTRPVTADIDVEEARFYGLTRECGLHTENFST